MKAEQSQAIAETRREYQRNWRKRNPEKVKQHNEQYWLRRVQKTAIRERSAKNDQQTN